MIYLILKMFIYLLLALCAGTGAGWVLRHITAAKQEEEMQRTLADARARVPQFESLIRTRDEQIDRLKEELKDKDVRINGLADDVREAELAFKDKDRELKQFSTQDEMVDDLPDEPVAATEILDTGEVLAEVLTDDDAVSMDNVLSATQEAVDSPLADKVVQLEAELREARAQAADAMAEAASTEAEVITLKAELARAGATGPADNAAEVADLEARLMQKTTEYERLAREFEVEQRRVAELERERKLQNKSLQVLHQQLELEKERGQRVVGG